MWNKIKIREIRSDALRSLSTDFSGNSVKRKQMIYFYYLGPIIISSVLLSFKVKISVEIANYFITGISIFSGLFFNLLLVVADKMNTKKQQLAEDFNEETTNYLIRYKIFSQQLISQISYAIILSVFLILLMFVTNIISWVHNIKEMSENKFHEIFDYSINALIFFLGAQFVLLLLVILSSMYVMLLDDIKIKLRK